MISHKTLKLLVLCAAVAMLLPLPIMQYVGEESYYTLGAYEIFVRQEWWHQSIFGMDWPKTPLYNWLIIGVAKIIGWQHLDVAPRIVSVAASWGSAFVVFLMARRFFSSYAHAPWLASLLYLTMGEISFWYGWLGYADATFSFFIFSAMASMWVAIEDESFTYLAGSLILISLAFMVKNISCYVLLGTATLILLHRQHRWYLLRKPWFMLPCLLALTVPWLYQHFALAANTRSNSIVAIFDALRNFTGYSLLDYLGHWLTYPILFLTRAFPVTLLIIWFYWREKQRYVFDLNLMTLAWILLACLAPFWLSAAGSPRYLIPFYGLLALLLTGLVLQLDSKQTKLVLRAMLFMIIIKIPYSFAILPYIKDWRPERDIKAVVEDILQTTEGKTIRTRDDVATGLSIGVYLDVQLPAEQYIRWYDGKEKQVYILCDTKIPELGKIVKSYRLRGDDVFLYWQP
jgi:hypothetical protein